MLLFCCVKFKWFCNSNRWLGHNIINWANKASEFVNWFQITGFKSIHSLNHKTKTIHLKKGGADLKLNGIFQSSDCFVVVVWGFFYLSWLSFVYSSTILSMWQSSSVRSMLSSAHIFAEASMYALSFENHYFFFLSLSVFSCPSGEWKGVIGNAMQLLTKKSKYHKTWYTEMESSSDKPVAFRLKKA